MFSFHWCSIDCQQRTLVPPFNSGANAASVPGSAGTDVGRGSLETTGNVCHYVSHVG